MIICIDFDGTLVSQDHPYHDLETPLQFMPGAFKALIALKLVGHTLILWSARASWALRKGHSYSWPVVNKTTPESRQLNEARYQQMLTFLHKNLHGVFDYICDGSERSKPHVDLFIDDKALTFGAGAKGWSWAEIAESYGGK